MLKKTHFFKSAVLSALVLSSACSSDESHLLEHTSYSEAYADIQAFKVAIVPTTSASDASIEVFISAPESVVKETIKFCLGAADVCASSDAEKISVSQHLNRAGFYKVDRLLSVATKQHYTITGNDQAGSSYRTTVRIDDNDCHLAPDDFTCRVEMEVLRLTNVKRTSNGRNAFSNAKFIGCASRLWSVEMARRGSISHDWFSNGTLRQRYRSECSGTGSISAENVAMSGGSGQTPESVASQFVNMWWNSSGHRANMMGNYRSMGIGFHKRGNSWYGTQNFGAE